MAFTWRQKMLILAKIRELTKEHRDELFTFILATQAMDEEWHENIQGVRKELGNLTDLIVIECRAEDEGTHK